MLRPIVPGEPLVLFNVQTHEPLNQVCAGPVLALCSAVKSFHQFRIKPECEVLFSGIFALLCHDNSKDTTIAVHCKAICA